VITTNHTGLVVAEVEVVAAVQSGVYDKYTTPSVTQPTGHLRPVAFALCVVGAQQEQPPQPTRRGGLPRHSAAPSGDQIIPGRPAGVYSPVRPSPTCFRIRLARGQRQRQPTRLVGGRPSPQTLHTQGDDGIVPGLAGSALFPRGRGCVRRERRSSVDWSRVGGGTGLGFRLRFRLRLRLRLRLRCRVSALLLKRVFAEPSLTKQKRDRQVVVKR
jgi:hypothetical protein